jgi:hypothetical protein
VTDGYNRNELGRVKNITLHPAAREIKRLECLPGLASSLPSGVKAIVGASFNPNAGVEPGIHEKRMSPRGTESMRPRIVPSVSSPTMADRTAADSVPPAATHNGGLP